MATNQLAQQAVTTAKANELMMVMYEWHKDNNPF